MDTKSLLPRLTLLALVAACQPAGSQYTPVGGTMYPPVTTGGDSGPGTMDTGDAGTESMDGGVSGDGGEPDGGDGGMVDAGPTPSLPTQPCGTSDADGKNSMAPLAIGELYFDVPEFVEFYNHGPAATNLNDFTFSGSIVSAPAQSVAGGQYSLLGSNLSGESGDIAISQGGIIVFYACWGSLVSDSLQQQAAAVWTTQNECVPTPPAGQSLHLTGQGTAATDWHAGPPTPLGCTLQ